jgi:metal-responsive CopG/Arc/MetJ family transcriptional regulator
MKNKIMIGRPKIKNKKENISLSLNKELISILDEYLKNKNINKSEYVEYLLKKEIVEKVKRNGET